MSTKTDILKAVAEKTGPMAMYVLKEMIEASKTSSFIRDGLRLLFIIKHESIRKKINVKSGIYWLLVQKLIDAGLVHKHILKLEGQLNQKVYIEFDFGALASLASDVEGEAEEVNS